MDAEGGYETGQTEVRERNILQGQMHVFSGIGDDGGSEYVDDERMTIWTERALHRNVVWVRPSHPCPSG
jgi:hypothetical protein